MKKLLASLAILSLLSACANQTPAQKTATTNAINNVIAGAVDYAQGNDAGAVINGIQGASYFVRSLQSTPNAANPDAVVAAVTEGTVATPTQASPALTTLGTTVANAVVTLTSNGTPPNAANEQVAAALDKAVIQIAAPSQASLPVNWISQDGFPHICHAYRVKIDPSAFNRNRRLAGIPVTPLTHDCDKDGHVYGPWYKQSQMFYLPEQPAHICKYCGAFQNASGRLMQLVSSKEIPGGNGTMSLKDANSFIDSEMMHDFKSWENYKILPAEDRYGKPVKQDLSLPVRNAAFRRLSRADQRDATSLFNDERALTFAANPQIITIRP